MADILDEKEIVRLMREEWSARKARLLSEIAVELGDRPIIGPGLKIVDKDGNLFTVVSVGNQGAILEDPVGEKKQIEWEKLEKEYSLQ